MRQLTKKQKEYLRRLYATYPDIKTVDDLDSRQFSILCDMNDTEIICQEANRFLWDLRFNQDKI